MKRILATLASVAALGLSAFSAGAQSYPERAITVVVPFSAGGPTDTVTRLIAEPMAKSLGTEIVVQNVEGAGGTVAAGQVAKAEPDGYTILMHHIGMSTAPTLYKSLPYKPLEDFATIGLVTEVPMTIVGRKDLEPATLQELVDYVKTNKDKVTYANAGIGAASHLCGMLFMEAVGTQVTTVPYKGTGPALTDLLGGQVDFMCDQTTNTTGQIKGGQVKAYAVTSAERLASLPDLPTTKEGGLRHAGERLARPLCAGRNAGRRCAEAFGRACRRRSRIRTVIDRFAELGTTPVAQDRATPQAHTEMLFVADRPLEADHRSGRRSRPVKRDPAERTSAAPPVRQTGIAVGDPRAMTAQKSLKDLLSGLIFIGLGLAFGYAALSATNSAPRSGWGRAISRWYCRASWFCLASSSPSSPSPPGPTRRRSDACRGLLSCSSSAH